MADIMQDICEMLIGLYVDVDYDEGITYTMALLMYIWGTENNREV